MREYQLGRFAGLDLSVMPSAFVGSLILWIGLSALAMTLLHFSWTAAVAMSFIATLLHWLAETLHQLRHAAFASRTGYPMRGIRYWGALSSSLYPPDEPVLIGPTHLRRALGGPTASFMVALLGGLLFIVLSTLSVSDALRFLAFFFLIDNLVAFAWVCYCRWASPMAVHSCAGGGNSKGSGTYRLLGTVEFGYEWTRGLLRPLH